MPVPETIRSAGDLEDLIRALMQETVEAKDELQTRGLTGAQVLRPGAALDPSFVLKLRDGRQFVVIVREIETSNAPPI